jgi:hypothetical protein
LEPDNGGGAKRKPWLCLIRTGASPKLATVYTIAGGKCKRHKINFRVCSKFYMNIAKRSDYHKDNTFQNEIV